MFFDDLLDERKKSILKAIIDDYIDTAEPLGSRTIARKHGIGLSSATIRNEMADLEEMGFLCQLHTSSGRIPSNLGYRFYVDRLMKRKELVPEELETIRSMLDDNISELTQLIRQVSVLIARITRYTSVAVTPRIARNRIKTVRVIPIDTYKGLVIVVTNTGIIKNNVVYFCEPADPDMLIMISNFLSSRLPGLTTENIDDDLVLGIRESVYIPDELLLPVMQGIRDCINQIDGSEIYLEGAANILNYPEFCDIIKAKDLLNLMEEKSVLAGMLQGLLSSKGLSVRIGTENKMDQIENCTVITATYSYKDTILGTIGIIGPTRMEYSRVISIMDYIRDKVNIEIKRLVGSGDDNIQ
ncbi:MAG: heat-inducible transcriptional repressor HrcA [Eubacteriales bacterium]|nr:heat-inducible transcriptional repressor HrcA [Eubacteriales bacterium]